MNRYAWLEFDGGMWHFVKNLCAVPSESTRRWSDKDCALTDLTGEGWTVVRPYSANRPAGENGENKNAISGYGLVRHLAEAPLSMSCSATDSDRPNLDSNFFTVFLRDYVAVATAKKI